MMLEPFWPEIGSYILTVWVYFKSDRVCSALQNPHHYSKGAGNVIPGVLVCPVHIIVLTDAFNLQLS